MILTGERVDAATALRIGLVEEVASRGQSLAAATTLAQRVATLSPRAVSFSKRLIHQARRHKRVPAEAQTGVEKRLSVA
jgi:enoyl-CoA hydratase/carnithine racemase